MMGARRRDDTLDLLPLEAEYIGRALTGLCASHGQQLDPVWICDAAVHLGRQVAIAVQRRAKKVRRRKNRRRSAA